MCGKVVVEFQDVTKHYPASWLGRRTLSAVTGVSFQIEAGQVFALLGPNRAGKTTLVKMLLSLCRPTSGQVFRLGSPVADRRTLGRVGYVHESQALPHYLTATTLLDYYAALSQVPELEARQRVPQLLELVGLADRSREPIARFSKGMIQRLALAQALINDPDLLVMDEPTEGLDLIGRKLVLDVIAERRQAGRSVLLVSHMLTDVERVCDQAAVIVNGRLVHLGPLSTLTTNPIDRTIRPLEESLQEYYMRESA